MPDQPTPTFEQIFADDLFKDAPDDLLPKPTTLDPERVFADAAPPTPGGSHVDSGRREPRFDGDSSELPHEVCWALQELVAAPHVSEKGRGRHWPVVLQYEQVLRRRLSELGLILEINYERRYAFTRQAEDPSPRSRAILRAKTLSLAASALALYLYRQYVTSPDEPVVETADMVDHMLAYKRPGDTDVAAFHKRVASAIETLAKLAIMRQVKGTERYVVHGVITSILTAENVDSLCRKYQAIARGESISVIDDDQDDAQQDHADRGVEDA